MKTLRIVLSLRLLLFIILPQLLFSQYATSLVESAHKTSFSFIIDSSAVTSAGVFLKDGTLVRTLWSGVYKLAGTYNNLEWDGLDDLGNSMALGQYDVKILSNNVHYTWEGIIGNTSDNETGSTVHGGYEQIQSMAIAKNYAYVANGYNEGKRAQTKFSLSAPNSKLELVSLATKTNNQTALFVASDSTRVYWAGFDPFTSPYSSFIFATNVSDDLQSNFSSGSLYNNTTWNVRYESAIDQQNSNDGLPSGMAVQHFGNYLFVSHRDLNKINVLDKTTGAVVRTIAFNAPKQLAFQSDYELWINSGTNTVQKYTVNSNGTITPAGISVSGLVMPIGLAVSPDNASVTVVDAGTNQQVRGFNPANGLPLWTLGQAGGYTTEATVTNSKFDFYDKPGLESNPQYRAISYICYEGDGSFWIGDTGNGRNLHFNRNRVYIEQLSYVPSFLSCRVDQNNPTRVFADYLEFSIDYSKPISPNNGSWKLVKNWSGTIPIANDGFSERLRDVTTLSNGRTYALCPAGTNWQVIELVDGGTSRLTDVSFQRKVNGLNKDGSIGRWKDLVIGQKYEQYKSQITGFNGSNDPQWGNEVSIGSTEPVLNTDPVYWDFGNYKTGQLTSNGLIISFDGDYPPSGSSDYHLGAFKGNKWIWKTARSTASDYNGPFPPDGKYDLGNGASGKGTVALAVDKQIIWGFHGENWKGGQTNKYNHVYEDGLFVGQFGVTRQDVAGQEAAAGMAGNALSPNLVKVGDDLFLYHNDENDHSGIHRWKISGLNTILEQVIQVNLSNELSNSYYRSIKTGGWMDLTTWQSSNDSTNWGDAAVIPSISSNSIIIQSGHTITVTDSATVDQLSILDGGVLEVAPKASLIINDGPGNDIFIAPTGSLIIKSDSTGTGRIGNSSGTISGNITVEQYISALNKISFRLLSPSVNTLNGQKPFIRDNWQEGQNNTSMSINSNLIPRYGIHITGSTTGANGFDATSSGASSMSTYNPSSASNWIPIPNTNATNLDAKTGYLVQIRGDRSANLRTNNAPSSTTLRATGTMLTGTQLFKKPAGDRRTFMVTNPYPCPINWNAICNDALTSNSKNFENFYIYWDPTVGSGGGYVTVTTTGINSASTTASAEIPAGQAFIITAKKGIISPVLTVKESHKSTSNHSVSSAENEQFISSLYYLNSEGTRIMADAVNTVFYKDFPNPVNTGNAEELENPDENIAIMRTRTALSIERRPSILVSDTLPLSVKRLKHQSYEWQFDPTNFAHPGLKAYLDDKFLNTRTAISLVTKTVIAFYVSDSLASAAEDRFRIIFAPSEILPVTISSINAYQVDEAIQVDWTVQYQSQTNWYNVEKSLDGHQFYSVGSVPAKAAYLLTNSYSWVDTNPQDGKNFYRIRTMELSGATNYSKIAIVSRMRGNNSIDVFPNPIKGNNSTIHFNNVLKGLYTIKLINKAGQVISKITINYLGGYSMQTIPIDAQLPSGKYILDITGNGMHFTKAILK